MMMPLDTVASSNTGKPHVFSLRRYELIIRMDLLDGRLGWLTIIIVGFFGLTESDHRLEVCYTSSKLCKKS